MIKIVRALIAALETNTLKNSVMCREPACLLACSAGRLSLTLHPPRVGAHEAKAGSWYPVFVL